MQAYGQNQSPYEQRPVGDSRKKQSMAELKLRRLNELNVRLQEDLQRRRIKVSDASDDLIKFTDREPKDFMVPSRWGNPERGQNPYEPVQSGGCCTVM